MTKWLPIDTYPYDGTWGLFRGGTGFDGVRGLTPPSDCWQDIPCILGSGIRKNNPELKIMINYYCFYEVATEWLPLSILDMIEPHQVTAARLMI